MRLFILFCLMISAGGCTWVGIADYVVSGPPVHPAAYKLKAAPTLVIAENYRQPSAVAMDADRFAAALTGELREHQLAPVVDVGGLYALRERKGADYAKMKVSEIGRELGAEQVLYVDVITTGVEVANGTMMKGKMALRLKVIDTENGATLWPADMAEGFPVGYETPVARMNESETPAMLRTELIDQMATRTARLFYDWKPDDLDQAAEGRGE